MKVSGLVFLLPLLLFVRDVGCQEKQLELLTPMVSTRVDVEKHFGKGESNENITWYYLKESSIKIVYSDGSCTEEWRAPVDTVIEAAVYFKTRRPLAALKRTVNYRHFRYEEFADNKGERHYYDDVRGRKYGIDTVDNVWLSFTLYPRREFAGRRCDG